MFKPDDYRTDPYGFLTNQISHGYVGMFAMAFYCWAVLHLTGEYPDQTIAGITLIAVYFVGWEVAAQGWRGADTIEDTYFVSLGVVPWFAIDMSQIIDRLFVWAVLVMVSLALGVTVRVRNAGKN